MWSLDCNNNESLNGESRQGVLGALILIFYDYTISLKPDPDPLKQQDIDEHYRLNSLALC